MQAKKNSAAVTAELITILACKITRMVVSSQGLNSSLRKTRAGWFREEKHSTKRCCFCCFPKLCANNSRSEIPRYQRKRARDLGLVSRAPATVDCVDFATTPQVRHSAAKTTKIVDLLFFIDFAVAKGAAAC